MSINELIVDLKGQATRFLAMVGLNDNASRQGSVTVEVACAVDSGPVRLAVADTGIGVDPADQEKIFEDFQQADPSTERRYGGAGLGLAISRRLAHMLNGRLELDSRPGVGSTFTLVIPLRP